MKNAFVDCERPVASRYQPQRFGSCRAMRGCTPQPSPIRSTTASALPASRTSRGSIRLGRHHYSCIELIACILLYEHRFRNPDFRPVERSQVVSQRKTSGANRHHPLRHLLRLIFPNPRLAFREGKLAPKAPLQLLAFVQLAQKRAKLSPDGGDSVHAYFQNFNSSSDSGCKAASSQTLAWNEFHV